MNSQLRVTLVIAAIPLLLTVAFPQQLVAQSAFVRNDGYLWPVHDVDLAGSGDDWSHRTPVIQRPSDYRSFRIHASTGNWVGGYQISAVLVDMNEDGIDDLRVVGLFQEGTLPWSYPEPTGWSATHTVRVTVQGTNNAGQGNTRTAYVPITTVRTPRVYIDGTNDALVQMKNEDCSSRIPLILSESIDWSNQTYPEAYTRNYAALAETLYALNFELFVVNFNQGGGDIVSNATVFSSALAKVHELCPNSEIAVLGFSMGAVIARCALAKQESQHVAHHVGLFIAYDSPLSGAWVNPQLTSELARTVSSNEVIVAFQSALQTAAAKQLLLTNPYDPDATEFHRFHDATDTLNVSGYPHQSYNVAISNGNFSRAHGNGWVNAGLFLLSLTILRNNQGIPAFSILSQPYDRGVGSISWEVPTPLVLRGDLFDVPFVGDIDYIFAGEYVPVFVPTWSALGMQLANVNFNPWGDMVDPIPPSPFDEYLVQDVTKRKHLEVTAYTKPRLVAWLTSKEFTLTVNYNLPGVGVVSSESYQVPILKGLTVTPQPKTVTINGVQYVCSFAGWDDGNAPAARTFFMPHDSVRTVNLRRAALTTGTSGAQANTQPRITEVADPGGGTQHVVYESNGSIWYLRNRHNVGWEAERLISNQSTARLDPTIVSLPRACCGSAVVEDEIEVSAAWLSMPVPPTDPAHIMYNTSYGGNGLWWGSPSALGAGAGPRQVLLAKPNCDGPGGWSPCRPALMWVDAGCGDQLCPAGVYYMKAPDVSSAAHPLVGAEGDVSGATAISCDECVGGSHEMWSGYRLAFIRNGRIYTRSYIDHRPLDASVPPDTCSGTSDLSTAGWTAANPSMVSSDGKIFLAWEEASGSSHRIAFKERTPGLSGTWSATTYFTHLTHVPTKAVLGVDHSYGNPAGSGPAQVILLWQCGDHVALVSRAVSGSVWTSVGTLGLGKAPSIATAVPGNGKPTAMWTSGTSAPYAISLRPSPIISTIEDVHEAGCTMMGVNLAWTAPSNNGSGAVSGYEVRYSTAPIDESNWLNATVASAAPGPLPPGSEQSVWVNSLAPCTWYYFAVKGFVNDWGRLVYGGLSNQVEALSARTRCVANSPCLNKQMRRGPAPPEEGDVDLPRELAMRIVSANPTDGRLDVEYAIPGGMGGWVELAAFDVTGRKVATIRKESANPGRYKVQWGLGDDRGARSGLYWLRLTLGERRIVRAFVVR